MRIARNFAALVALATVGFAVGDFATHPNPLGALGLLALIAVFAFLLSYLFRPAGARRAKLTPAEPERTRERAVRTKPETVWTGWGAEEAQVAREQRRPRRRGPSS